MVEGEPFKAISIHKVEGLCRYVKVDASGILPTFWPAVGYVIYMYDKKSCQCPIAGLHKNDKFMICIARTRDCADLYFTSTNTRDLQLH